MAFAPAEKGALCYCVRGHTPSCPRLSRHPRLTGSATIKDVDGRDKPGHDAEATVVAGLLHRAPDCVGKIGLFPREAAVLFRRTPEVAVSRGAAVDGPVQLEGAA